MKTKSAICFTTTIVVSIIAFAVSARIGYEYELVRFSEWRIKRNVVWADLCDAMRKEYPETGYAFCDNFYFNLSLAIDSNALSQHDYLFRILNRHKKINVD